MTALTDNIQSIDYDNSYAHIDFTQSYDANKTFRFAFRWVQEYMYTLSDSGAVSYDYTPGWFDSAPVDVMTLTWHDPASVAGVGSDGQTGGDHVLTASNMKPGERLNFTVEYASWPSTLYWENSRDNLPDNSRGDDSYDDSDDSDNWVFTVFVIFVLVIFFVVGPPPTTAMPAASAPATYSSTACGIPPARMAAIPVPAPWAPSISPPRPAAVASAAESVAAVLEAVASAEAAIAPAPPAVPVPVPATMDSMAASSEAVTSSSGAPAAAGAPHTAPGRREMSPAAAAPAGWYPPCQGKSGGTTATSGASVSGVQ